MIGRPPPPAAPSPIVTAIGRATPKWLVRPYACIKWSGLVPRYADQNSGQLSQNVTLRTNLRITAPKVL
jgi:hypothetical protein